MPNDFGTLLRQWRGLQRMSQLDLALDAEVSTRHISFMETGRAKPSREMVLILGSALDMPLRDRNTLLQAAGFAAAYTETGLDAPALAQVRQALEFMLSAHEPYGAVVLDKRWNVKMANRAHTRAMSWLLGPDAPAPENLALAVFDPRALRPYIANFDEFGALYLARLRRDATTDPRMQSLVDRALSFGPVPATRASPGLLLPLVLEKDGMRVSLFSTIATLGTPQDITLQEVRIETFFPADEASETALRMLAGTS